MIKFQKFICFLLFFSIKSNEVLSNVSDIKKFLEDTIPKIKDINNELHPFFFYFKNQNNKKLIKIKNSIQNFSLADFVKQNPKIFEKCNTKTDFFSNLIAMQKYVEIAIFLQKNNDEIKSFVEKADQSINNKNSMNGKYDEIKEEITSLKEKLNNGDFSKNNIDKAKLIYAHYIDNSLDLENKEIKQTIYKKFDEKSTPPTNKNGWKKKTLITFLIVASLSALGYYLLLTQTEEIKQNNQGFFQTDNFTCT